MSETVQSVYDGAMPDTHQPDCYGRRVLVITDCPDRFKDTSVAAVKVGGVLLGARFDRVFIDGAVEVTPQFCEWLTTRVLCRMTTPKRRPEDA